MAQYAKDCLEYVRQYSKVESLLADEYDIFWPRIQVRGQLLELALKAYLAACDVYKEGHDLVDLADQAHNHGLKLTEKQRVNYIPNLNKIYYYHEGRNWYYLSRYADHTPRLGVWITPTNAAYAEMIDSIVQQTNEVVLSGAA